MAKVLVYEGGGSNMFGQVAAIDRTMLMNFFKGGAIGAGGVTLLDMIIPKIPVINRLSPLMRNVAMLAGTGILGAYLYRRGQTDLGVGIGLGGGSICAYKIVQHMLGKVVTVPALRGYGQAEEEEEVPEEAEVTVEETPPYGILTMTEYEKPYEGELGQGEEEILVEEY